MNTVQRAEADLCLKSALIVDDHPLFCEALSMTLSNVVGIQSISCTNRLEPALAVLAGKQKPSVVVLDLNLPDVNGLEGLVRVKSVSGDVPIVVVSSMTEPRIVRSALRLGANGFVPKHSPRHVFREAFAKIAAGGVWLPEDMALEDDDAPDRGMELAAKLALLTRQQGRILQLICQGLMNKQIAFLLSIAETTVKAHVTEIMRKLQVVSRTQALLLAKEGNISSLLLND
ncbi:response regulator [Tabrizicola sp.]|uniref:response regulator n=1 Tax=Tabrizicola sp. TaxID=2005166 RepID=UPI003F3ACA1A